MILRTIVALCILVVLPVSSLCCSARNSGAPATGNPVAPATPAPMPDQSRQLAGSSHYPWGFYLIYIDPARNQAEIAPVRLVTEHWNVLKWLEHWPCSDCLKITNFVDSPHGTKLVDIRITHPFTSANLTGFDVRGIAMFNGSWEFPASGLNMPDGSMGDGELVNADGYTTLYNISTLGCGPGGLQGYMKGRFATPQAPSALLNGYKRHITNDPANTRNAFYADSVVTVTYDIDMPDAPLVLGYAIDASWAPPVTKPVTDPIADFGPEANCPEPWRIEAGADPIGQTGETVLVIDVYDRQGKTSINPPIVECPDLFDGSVAATWTQNGPGFSRWTAPVQNTKLADEGLHRCLISVEDKSNDPGAAPWLDLTAYQVVELEVYLNTGWAHTWGDIGSDQALSVAAGNSRDLYVCGGFSSTVDFDLGPGTDLRISNGGTDIFLTKHGSDGRYYWTVTWGGPEDDKAYSVDLDDAGGVFVAGYFGGEVDFDPDPAGEELLSSSGPSDMFSSKFDTSGDFQWCKIWGLSDKDGARGVATDGSGNVYVTGYSQVAYNSYDVFLRKWDGDGNLMWRLEWDKATSALQYDDEFGVDVDDQGNVYVTGVFTGTVDFDPGPGVDEHTSAGSKDVFLTKLDTGGGFLWARTWGGDYYIYDGSTGVAVDLVGNVYVSGYFGGDVDFDPGPGEDWRTADGLDAFLSEFGSDGDYVRVLTWGGPDFIEDIWHYGQAACGVTTDDSRNVYITGNFAGATDLDPGPGFDLHTAEGASDSFVIAFDPDLNHRWARSWGGNDDCCLPSTSRFWETGWGVAVDADGAVCVVGGYSSEDSDPVNLAPTGPPCDSDPDIHPAFAEWDAFLVRYLPDGCW